MRWWAASLFLVTMTSGAGAQSFFPPKGCSAFLTVQNRSCNVSLFWRCEAAPAGTVWEANYDAEGPVSVHTYDREYQWLDSYFYEDQIAERLYEAGPDPISMTELLETGRDTYDFKILELGGDERRILRTTGEDVFVGQTVEIDGVKLKTALVNSTITDEQGELVFHSKGFQYVLPEERLFFLGKDENTNGTDTWEDDNSPVEFVRPDEPGFGSTTPIYDCGDSQMSVWRP